MENNNEFKEPEKEYQPRAETIFKEQFESMEKEKTAITHFIESMEKRKIFLQRRLESFPEMTTSWHRIKGKITEITNQIAAAHTMRVGVERPMIQYAYSQGRYDQWHDDPKTIPTEEYVAENAQDFIDETYGDE